MKYRELFGSSCPVMAMLHLRGYDEKEVLERAKREANCYLEHGVEALLVENYFGSADDCERVLEWLSKEHPDACYGVNILGDYKKAFELASRYRARFLQIDSVCGHLKPKHDEAYADALQACRQNSDVVVLGGVRFKYQAVASGRSEAEDLLLGMQRCDAIVVTGAGTGLATPVEKVERFRRTVGDFPLVVGAGVTPEVLADTVACSDGMIVGSYFKEDHHDIGDVCPAHVNHFMNRKRQLMA